MTEGVITAAAPTIPMNPSTRNETRTTKPNLRITRKVIKFTTIMAVDLVVDMVEAQDSSIFLGEDEAFQVSQEAEIDSGSSDLIFCSTCTTLVFRVR